MAGAFSTAARHENNRLLSSHTSVFAPVHGVSVVVAGGVEFSVFCLFSVSIRRQKSVDLPYRVSKT